MIHTFLSLILYYANFCLFHVEFIGLSSLESLPSFWIPSLAHSCSRLCTTHLTPPFSALVCCLSMPPKRESLKSVKSRLVREQKAGTDRRVSQLLSPRQRQDDSEVSDDSEEENRLIGRLPRQTLLTLPFVVVCLLVFLCLLFVYCLVLSLWVDMAEKGWKSKGDKVPRRSPRSPRHEKCAFWPVTLFEKQGGKGYIFLASAWLNREMWDKQFGTLIDPTRGPHHIVIII